MDTREDAPAPRYTLEEKIAYATEMLTSAQLAAERANGMNDRAREMGCGIPGFGGSGSQRAAKQVRGAWQTADRAWADANARVELWTGKLRYYTRTLAEKERRRLTREDIVGAVAVRTQYGWHRVAKVNAKTVSVETGYSWTDRYTFDKILEVRS